MKLNYKLVILSFSFVMLILTGGCNINSTASSTTNPPNPISDALITYSYSLVNGESLTAGESFTVTATLTSTESISDQTIESKALVPSSQSFTFSSPATPCIVSTTSPTCTMTVNIESTAESGNYTLTMQTQPLDILETNSTISFQVTHPLNLHPMILITNTGYSGSLGTNIATLDNICNTDVTKPSGDTRTYKALVSIGGRVACTDSDCVNGTAGQNDWVLLPNTTYYRGDNTTMIFTTNESSIYTLWPANNSVIESDTEVSVWTATFNWVPMTENSSCSAWSTTSGTGRSGIATDANFMMYRNRNSCEDNLPIYCVSQ